MIRQLNHICLCTISKLSTPSGAGKLSRICLKKFYVNSRTQEGIETSKWEFPLLSGKSKIVKYYAFY